MTTMTMEPKTLKLAMRKIGLSEKADELLDILDDMLLKRELQLSLEEIERGEYEDVFEATADIKRKLAEGR